MIHKTVTIILLIINTSFLGLNTVFGQDDLSGVFSKVDDAVVVIDYEDKARMVGSGVIIGITKEGSALILTADHVVSGYKKVLVSFAGEVEKTYSGTVKEYNIPEIYDIAFVAVQDPPQNLQLIKFRKSVAERSELVGTIGHPLGGKYTWSQGDVSNIIGDMIQHTAVLDVGSSGGPLLDGCGRMLGMNVKVLIKQTYEVTGEDGNTTLRDTLAAGESITLSSGSIISVMEGLFDNVKFKKKWKTKKYCSFGERMYKDPVFLVLEAAIIGGIVYAIFKPEPEEDQAFGAPPGPPD